MTKKLNFRFRGLAFRYGFYVLTSVVIVFFIAFFYTFTFTYKILLHDAEQNASNITQLTIAKIRSILQPVEEIPFLLARRLENPGQNVEPILKNLKSFVQQNKEVYGSCIAFEPFQYDKKLKYYAPYLYEKSDSIGFKNLNTHAYDYLNQPWYKIPKETGKSVWSAPYFDKGGGDMFMCTYSVPFYRKENGIAVFNGVVTMDISLTTLQEIVDSIHIFKSGFGFLVTKDGNIITYPDSTKINKDIREVIKNVKDTNVLISLNKMLTGANGFVRLFNILEEKPSWMYYSPVVSTEWSLGLIFPSTDLLSSFINFTWRFVLIFALSLLALLILIIWITRRFTKPLTRLAYATREVGKGNLLINLPVYKAKDEIMELSNSFILMQEELKQYIENLKETAAAKEKMEGEISVARSIQLGMLPKSFPVRPDCDISAVLEPARGIGGDLYDFLFDDEGRLFFIIGDVSGKGVPASLFMAVTRTLFRSGIVKQQKINELVAEINNELCKDNPNQMFVTFIAVVLNLNTGALEICNAGHNPPLVLRKDGSVEKILQRDGLPLGVFEDVVYTSSSLQLGINETIVLYTDGITDAMKGDDQLFGEENFLKSLNEGFMLTPREIIEKVLDDVREFIDNADPFDDITMIAVKYLCKESLTIDGLKPEDRVIEREDIELLNEITEITKLEGWLKELELKLVLPSKVIMEINLALEELISNIIFYGYEDQARHVIKVELIKSLHLVKIKVIDDGMAFNILEQVPSPDTNSNLEDRSVGGLGIFLVKKLMDDVSYERIENNNVVTIIKYIN